MERERITISIKKKVLNLVDRSIDGINIRNRSHAFETFVLQGGNKAENRMAVVLLGGDNALDILEETKKNIKKLKAAGFQSIIVAVGFLGSKIKANLGNGQNLGVTIEYFDKGKGSGGALKALRSRLTSSFVVINSSEAIATDINKLFEFHHAHKSSATVATNSLDHLEGAYILEPEIVDLLPNDFSMIEEDLMPKLAKGGELLIYPMIG